MMQLLYDYPVQGKGPHLQARYIAGLCYDAGWRDADKLLTAVSVCLAEGNGYIYAVHVNKPAYVDEATGDEIPANEDWGLWQINNASHPDVIQKQAFDPVFATKFAYQLYRDRNYSFRPWAAYTNGSWKDPNRTAIGHGLEGVRNYLAMRHNVYGKVLP